MLTWIYVITHYNKKQWSTSKQDHNVTLKGIFKKLDFVLNTTEYTYQF